MDQTGLFSIERMVMGSEGEPSLELEYVELMRASSMTCTSSPVQPSLERWLTNNTQPAFPFLPEPASQHALLKCPHVFQASPLSGERSLLAKYCTMGCIHEFAT